MTALPADIRHQRLIAARYLRHLETELRGDRRNAERDAGNEADAEKIAEARRIVEGRA